MSEPLSKAVKSKLRERQKRLKTVLHEAMRQYIRCRIAQNQGVKVVARPLMKTLVSQQKEINRIRKQLNQTPIRYIEDMRKVVKHL